MGFVLHSNLEKKPFIIDLPLCRVLLEDDKYYTWLLLVPRRQGVARIMDLASLDQLLLLQELDYTQKLLWDECQPTQLNVAAIGNKTPQLHIHVIARFDSDPAWPNTVWDHPTRGREDEKTKNSKILRLKHLFSSYSGLEQEAVIESI